MPTRRFVDPDTSHAAVRIIVAFGSQAGAMFGAVEQANDADAPSCRSFMAGRLERIDAWLAAWADDLRPSTLTARRIMVADRNDQARACRACGGCELADDALTDPLPQS